MSFHEHVKQNPELAAFIICLSIYSTVSGRALSCTIFLPRHIKLFMDFQPVRMNSCFVGSPQAIFTSLSYF